MALRKSRWGAESRRLRRVLAVLTQAAPRLHSAGTSRQTSQESDQAAAAERLRILAALGRRVQAAARPAPSESAPLPRCQYLLIAFLETQSQKQAAELHPWP